jgi:hypothetical protein
MSRPLILVGTRIEEDSKDDRKRKFVPVHEQTVVDEHGRRRFHGAFTGGFSAGYFNTVGSAEGFTPQQFRSSRADGKLAQSAQQQDVKQFMDAEDFAEFGMQEGVVANAQFTAIGNNNNTNNNKRTATVVAASAPFVPDELLQPARHGVGVNLLRTMGWRDGDGVGAKKARHRVVAAAEDDPDRLLATFEFAPRSVPVPEFALKNDRRGIGFDPYTNAADVRTAAERRREFNRTDERTQEGMRTRLTMANAVTGAEDRFSMRGYGIGALDDDNADEDADLYHHAALETYDIDLNPEQQQHRIEQDARKRARDAARDSSSGAHNKNATARLLLEDVDRNTLNAQRCSDGLPPLKGFRLAARTTEKEIHFPPPKVPPQYNGMHIFGPNDERPEDLATFKRRVTPQQRADLLSDGQRVARPAVGSQPPLASAVASIASRFAPAGATLPDAATTAPTPAPVEIVVRRTTQSWEPARIVCKRVGVPDPWAKRPLPADAVRAILEPKLLSASVAAVTSTRSFTPGSAPTEAPPADEPPAEPIVRPSADIFNAVFGADDSSDEHVVPPPPPTVVAAAPTNEFARHAQPLVPDVRPSTNFDSNATATNSRQQVSFAQLAESLGSHSRPRDVPRRPQALPIDVGGPLMRGTDGTIGPMPPPPAKARDNNNNDDDDDDNATSSNSNSDSDSGSGDERQQKRKRKSSKHQHRHHRHHHHHHHKSKSSKKSRKK